MSIQREQHDWLNLSGRVAVVTGAGSGIGAAIANGFAQAGAKVAVLDRNGQTAADVAARLAVTGDRGTAVGGVAVVGTGLEDLDDIVRDFFSGFELSDAH